MKKLLLISFILSSSLLLLARTHGTPKLYTPPLPFCDIFHDGHCKSDEIDMPNEFAARRWQTPKKNDKGYHKSYQDYSDLQGWIHIEYEKGMESGIVYVKMIEKEKGRLVYVFDGKKQSENWKKYEKSYKGVLKVMVIDDDKGYQLMFDDVDFIWNNVKVKEREGDYRNGQKGAIVEFFGWPDEDIEKECVMLSKSGYLGAKLFPHMEQLMSYVQPYNNEMNPWYFFYQPVSYRLEGRMGSRNDLKQLINTCRSLGVRVYADAVVNHMTGSGNDIQMHRNENGYNYNHENYNNECIYWPGKNSSAIDQSPYFTQGFCYMYNENTDLPPSQEFPAVPYGPLDFHCERPLSSWTSPLELNAGWLVGLTDLHTSKDHVRERIADYFVDLLSIGFSGFRIDAFKHIQPDDMVEIIKKFKRNLGGILPDDFFFWGELVRKLFKINLQNYQLIGGEKDMLLCNDDSGYNFAKYLENKFKEAMFTDEEILKLKLWSSWYPKEVNADCDKVDRRREVIQNDDHDQQTTGSSSRDMGDKGSVLVIAKDIKRHREFEKKLFSDPFDVRDNKNDWPIRTVLSSYWFNAPSGANAPPDGKSDCSSCRITCEGCRTVGYTPGFNDSACGYEGIDGNNNGYTRVHRDKSIIEEMRKWMNLPLLSNKNYGIPDRC